MWVLQSRYAFLILKGRTTLRGVAVSAALASVLAVAIVVADLLIRYPQDMNVPVPALAGFNGRTSTARL